MSQPFRRVARAILKRLPGAMRDKIVAYTPHEKIPRVYPTLKCNLRCPFCSDGLDYDKSHMGYEPLTAEQWITILDALPGEAVVFTGGEPTLYQPLPDVINAIHQTEIFVYTNLAYDVEKFLDRLTKPIRIFGSFHPNNKGVTAERIIGNIAMVRAHPMCRTFENVHTIRHPSNGDVDEHKRVFESAGLERDIYQDQFLTNSNSPAACNGEQLSTVRCVYDRVLIGPDGKRWICVSKMIRNIPDGLVPLDRETVPEMVCSEFGRCSPCDEVAKITPVGEQVPARA
jgi:hypothetical protein